MFRKQHHALLTLGFALLLPVRAGAIGGEQRLKTTDLFVTHLSTLAADAGQIVGLHVRRKTAADPVQGRITPADRVVLFIHGGTTPSAAAYDLEYKDYSWMAFLARAGMDVWAMDVSGYGSSHRPAMDDPCNVDPSQQQLLIGRPLKNPCPANYGFEFKTIRDDWKEIDTVVEHIRAVTGVERVSLIGWSAGGPRAGGYAATHPEKVHRVVLFAPSPPLTDQTLPDKPQRGFATRLQTREHLTGTRWEIDVRCPDQLDRSVHDPLWAEIMKWDRIGATWGPAEGVMRSPQSTKFGWLKEHTAKLQAPLIVFTGEFDRPDERRVVFDQAGSSDKVLVRIACTSHFTVWERPRSVLHALSLEWLTTGSIQNARQGVFDVDRDLRISRAN